MKYYALKQETDSTWYYKYRVVTDDSATAVRDVVRDIHSWTEAQEIAERLNLYAARLNRDSIADDGLLVATTD